MKKDIENRADIVLLVNSFYAKVKSESKIGPFFNKILNANWPIYLATMYNFWENIVLYTGTYEGGPMSVHKHLQHISPMNESNFARWDELFICTVDELF